MNKILKTLSLTCLIALVFAACTKYDKVADLPVYQDGVSPVIAASKQTIAIAMADSNNTVLTLRWTDPRYATVDSTTKYVVEIDSAGGSFVKPFRKELIGKQNVSYTGKELYNIVVNYATVIGAPTALIARVTSSYNNNNEKRISNTIPLKVSPFTDPSVFSSSQTTVTGTLTTASLLATSFSWTPSFKNYTGIVSYSIEYDSATKNFANAKNLTVGASTYNKDLLVSEINETSFNAGIPYGNTGKVEYRVKATTALGAISYSNVVSITINSYIPLLRFYMPGNYQTATGNGTNWTPANAPELIRDQRPGLLNHMYYTYIYLPAGSAFKFTQGRDWAVNYGGSGGTLSSGGSDLSVAADGVYRITIDVSTMQYDIREGRMGFVGGATGAGWNPPNVFPTYALGYSDKNLFVGLTDLTVDGWKLIDNNQWNSGSNTVDETRSYGSPNPSGGLVETNGGNFANPSAAGKYRVIWDGRDVDNTKYYMSDGTQMRVVGDGITGVAAWTPGVSPEMTYIGNNKWQITLNLEANKDIKFLAGDAWGAFDYEDNSGQSQATGTAKKIKWEGGDNFKTPTTAGSYTVTLDEGAQTVTIQ